MEQQNRNARKPDYKGDGIAIWVNEKDGNKYLSVRLLGSITLRAFKNEPKKEENKNTP